MASAPPPPTPWFPPHPHPQLQLLHHGAVLRAMNHQVEATSGRQAASPQGGMPKIAIRGLTKTFGDKVVLDGVDLDIQPGESMLVIGGSGSGKSVLLKCILGDRKSTRLNSSH